MTLVAVPFVLMAVLQRSPQWYPTFDQAVMELWMRDLGTPDSPLTGMPGRFEFEGHQGYHPGPLGWYALWPIYSLLGSSSWALLTSQVALGFIAIALLLWMLGRRGSPTRLLIAGLIVFLLARAYGIVVLSEVWNTHLPLLWWLVAVVATWCVLIGDRAFVAVLAFAGSLCVQSYVGYALPIAVLFLLTLSALVVGVIRGTGRRWSGMLWVVMFIAAVAALWAPVISQQLNEDTGNLWVIWNYFLNNDDESIGVGEGFSLVLRHLDAWRFVTGELPGDRQSPSQPDGSTIAGLVLLGVWMSAVLASWRASDRSLRRFHLVVAVVLVVCVVTASRITSPVWYWVVLFLWGVQALVLIGVGWSLAATLRPMGWRSVRPIGRSAAFVGAVAVLTVWAGENVVGPRLSDGRQSDTLASIMPPTVEAIRSGALPGGGVAGRYRVGWVDPASLGSAGYGFLNELERAGFDVGASSRHLPQIRPHRVLDEDDPAATARIEFVTVPWAERWLDHPGAVPITSFDPRSDEDRRRSEEVRAELIRRFAPDVELLQAIDGSPIALSFDGEVPAADADLLRELGDLGVPWFVVLIPPAERGANG